MDIGLTRSELDAGITPVLDPRGHSKALVSGLKLLFFPYFCSEDLDLEFAQLDWNLYGKGLQIHAAVHLDEHE